MVQKGQAQLMQRAVRGGAADPAKLAERVELLVQSTDRLAGMLNLLLDLARDSGRDAEPGNGPVPTPRAGAWYGMN